MKKLNVESQEEVGIRTQALKLNEDPHTCCLCKSNWSRVWLRAYGIGGGVRTKIPWEEMRMNAESWLPLYSEAGCFLN